MIYEGLLLIALVFGAGLIDAVFTAHFATPHARLLRQIYYPAVIGLYFTWQWLHGGQTLAMKTWRLRIVAADGRSPSTRQAWYRYGAAFIGTLACGLGFLWAVIDRDRQFLHDRLAGTRIIDLR